MVFSRSKACSGHCLSFLVTLPLHRGQYIPLSLTAVRKHFLQKTCWQATVHTGVLSTSWQTGHQKSSSLKDMEGWVGKAEVPCRDRGGGGYPEPNALSEPSDPRSCAELLLCPASVPSCGFSPQASWEWVLVRLLEPMSLRTAWSSASPWVTHHLG